MAARTDPPELAVDAATAIVRAAARLADAVEPDAVLRALADAAVPNLADWCFIHVAQGAGPATLAAVAHGDEAQRARAAELARAVAPTRDTAVGRVLATGRRVVFRDAADALLRTSGLSSDEVEAVRSLDVGSFAVLPLTARGRVLGSLTLALGSGSRRYESPLLAAAEALASQAALGLDNARLYAEQAEVARTLQRSLLPPRLPSIPGLELAVRYRTAGRVNAVGGDFYDAVAARDGTWRLVVGDVAGKGAEAAALTSLVRHTLLAAMLRDASPAASLALVNDALRHRGEGLTFCTVACASVRLRDGGADLEVVTAGHPPALVLRAGGGVEALDSRGPMLGVLGAVGFIVATTRLAPGDAVLLYTDGALELRGIGLLDGQQALAGVVADAAGRSAAELLERVERHALVLGGGTPRDDLALLAARLAPPDDQV